MSERKDAEREEPPSRPVNRREFIRTAGLLGAMAAATPSLLTQIAAAEAPPAAEAPGEEDLKTFMVLSEALTGSPLDPKADRALAREYLQRCLEYPGLGAALPDLLAAFRKLGPRAEKDPALIESQILSDPRLKAAAQQIIYLWYMSAFYDGQLWHYGPPAHYDRALIWPLMRTKPPMTQGGTYGYWKNPPQE